MSGFTLRRFTLQNITAVAAHCPIPGVSQAALNITYGPAAVRAAVHAATASTVNNDAQAGAASPPDVEAERMLKGGSLAGRVLSFLVSTTPSGTDAAGQAGSRFGLVTEEEMLWIQRRRREDAEESRVVLATRPTRNLLKGVGGGLLNVTLGCLLSPLLFITITLEKIRLSSNPLVGVLVGPVYGIAWAGVFLSTALYAAVQQTVLSFYYSCVAAPTYYLINRPTLQTAKTVVHPRAWFWSPLLCRFAVVRGGVGEREPLLLCYDENDVLRERAMKRLAVRRKKDKSSATYEGKKRKPGQSVDPEDYYGLLGVDKHASEREIKVAYNKLVLKIHPDKNPAPGAAAHFDNVTKAYRVLSNPEKRKKYDLGGAKGVEDLGAKKREGVRALFGGEALVKLSGDVFMGSFSQRVIDGLDYTQEELAVLQQRMLDACRDELLENYLSHFINWVDKQEPFQKPSSASGIGEKKTGNGSAFTSSHTKTTLNRSSSGSNGSARMEQSLNAWDGKMKMQLKKIVSTGLAKEVLYTIGSEYHRAIAYYDDALVKGAVTPGNGESGKKDQSSSNDGSDTHGASSVENVRVASFPTVISRRLARYVTLEGRHRAQQRLNKYKYFTKVRSDTFKSSESMIDLAWYSSVEDLEKTARAVALAVLFDPRITVAEAARRRAALAALADVFVHYGQVYKGANKQTMDQLMNSLRDYQQQREREKNL